MQASAFSSSCLKLSEDEEMNGNVKLTESSCINYAREIINVQMEDWL